MNSRPYLRVKTKLSFFLHLRFWPRFVLSSIVLSPLGAFGQVPARQANTTLTLPPEVFSSVAYQTDQLLFDNLLGDAVAMASPPGETNRLFVADRHGRILVIPDLEDPVPSVFLDITNRVKTVGLLEQGLLGLAFHPNYSSNRYFFVFYTGFQNLASDPGHQDTVSRFQTMAGDPNLGDPNSETILIQQEGDPFALNHNAGDLHFGLDGYLYISLGDGGLESNAQTIDGGFFSAIARIDVDNRPGSLPPNPHPSVIGNYSIPPDNPFFGITNFNDSAVDPNDIRTEFWAVGLRNPWRFSVDPLTGEIFCGDVGEDSWEEVNYIVKGANYGWPFKEGTNDFQGVPPPGTILAPPIAAVPWGDDLSVIGGFVYRGTRLPELWGHYIFSDWKSGIIRGLLPNGTNAVLYEDLATTFGFGPTAFAPDPRNGDILVCFGDSPPVIRRVLRNSSSTTNQLPATLAETGAFLDLTNLIPHTGILPYDINLSFWSDHAVKTRWFSVPSLNLDMSFAPEDHWTFPTSAVWIKHFEIEMTNGVPSSRRNLETRFLVKNEEGVYGITYRWAPGATNAVLVQEEGLDEELIIYRDSMIVTQQWRYPARSECLTCHTPRGGLALGFNTPQLNLDRLYGAITTNQIGALGSSGYLSTTPSNEYSWLTLAAPDDNSVSLEYRVRSYLQANCAQCHAGGGAAMWDASIHTPLSQTDIINGILNMPQGDISNRVVVPGDATHSMLLSRISTFGGNRMPPLASTVSDTQNIALVTTWIGELTGYQSFEDWQLAYFGSTNAPAAQLDADPDGDGLINNGEWLTQSNPTNALDAWEIEMLTISNDMPIIQFEQTAGRGFEVWCTTNLADSALWRRLNVPDNRPFFSSTTFTSRVTDTSAGGVDRKHYRVRAYEP